MKTKNLHSDLCFSLENYENSVFNLEFDRVIFKLNTIA